LTSNISKVKIEYEVSCDDDGFAINVNLDSDEGEAFEEDSVAAYMILITKRICADSGINFHKLLTNALLIEEADEPRWHFPNPVADA
jgi:hypothetical protein